MSMTDLKMDFTEFSGPDLPLPERFVSDSRKVGSSVGFVAVKGVNYDGHDFIGRAIDAGARFIVYEHDIAEFRPGIAYRRCADSARFYALCCRRACGNPDENLALFGVTGTNGKTTTAFLLAQLCEAAGLRCGLISTVEVRDGSGNVPATCTTPGPDVLFGLFAKMRDNGLLAVALELSSHALAQGRAQGTHFKAAIFTNLTGDHLDYHGDMEHYFQAKKLFFTDLLAPDGVAVINADDAYGRRLARELAGVRRVVTFGRESGADHHIVNLELEAGGSRFRLASESEAFDVGTTLIGEYNVHNLAGALVALLEFGVPPEALDRGLARPFAVPGRLELFRAPSGAHFYVDYAHTDDALANVLTILRRLTTGRLFVVFGAGGDRDRTKRPRMGAAAAKYADELIVTSDNPRSETPELIIMEIVRGIPEEKPFHLFVDRREAIEFAFGEAGANDTVLIAGKGHEDYQEVCGVRHHFSDREELRRLIDKG